MMVNNPPLISVIMPVYNGERFLRQAIDSILNQTIIDFELIIINDGSTDSSEDIILSYHDSRIKYVKNEYNLKLIKTLNKGLMLANGKYISRMDADDIADKYLFENQIKVFQTDDSVGIVNICTYDLAEKGDKYRKSSKPILFHSSILKYVISFENQITHPGIMVKADLMKKYGYKDNGTVCNFEDLDLWNRMLWDGVKCFTLRKRLLYYRINSSGVTRKVGSSRNDLAVKYCYSFLQDKLGISQIDTNALYFFYGGFKMPYKYMDALLVLRQVKAKIKSDFNDKKYVNEFQRWMTLRSSILIIQQLLLGVLPIKMKIRLCGFSLLCLPHFFTLTFFKYVRFKINNHWKNFK